MDYEFDFHTAYHQFYLSDKLSEKRTDSPTFWTPQAHDEMLAVEDGILGVGTACYGHVKGELNILDTNSIVSEYSKYDHVVEASIEINSGVLQILDCPHMQVEIEVNLPKGTYRVRVCSSNLDSVVGDDGDDYYKIEIWPSGTMGKAVLKQKNAKN